MANGVPLSGVFPNKFVREHRHGVKYSSGARDAVAHAIEARTAVMVFPVSPEFNMNSESTVEHIIDTVGVTGTRYMCNGESATVVKQQQRLLCCQKKARFSHPYSAAQ